MVTTNICKINVSVIIVTMKKWIIIFCAVFIAGGLVVISRNDESAVNRDLSRTISPDETLKSRDVKTSLFVPYWSLPDNPQSFSDYTELLYFGVASGKDGINTNESGFLGLADFVAGVPVATEKLLVLRMLDSKENFEILKDHKKQTKIINETIHIAKEHGFSGIVLDLELSALPFDSLIKQINYFNNSFYNSSRSKDLEYRITVYGDTYYRIRPFDIKTLAHSSDGIMVMAYDFHKSGGNPGPNFPLKGKDKYGYSYEELIDKLLTEVPVNKIGVIFGLYGYDWHVDEKNIAQSLGRPMSYLEIKNSILPDCQILSCKVFKDPLSAETQITYISTDGDKHIIWFEDMESVSKKQEYLKSKGIRAFSLWAHSYF